MIEKFVTGKCTLTISATGYETQTLDVTILRGRTLEFNMKLASQVIEFKRA